MSGRRCCGGRGGRSRRRRWRCGAGSCWGVRKAGRTSRSPPRWGSGRRRWASGAVVSWSPAWKGCPTSRALADLGRSPTSRSRRWWCPLWSAPRPVRRTGRGRRWRRKVGCRSRLSGGSGRVSGFSPTGSTRSSCPTIRSSSTRSATSSGSTWTRRRKRWSCAWMRSPRSRRWTARRRCCR